RVLCRSSPSRCVAVYVGGQQIKIGAAVIVPKTTVVPVIQIFPVGAIDDRVKAEACYGDCLLACTSNLLDDFIEPFTAATADMTGLGNQERATVARVNVTQ